MRTLGIDLATAKRSTGICEIDWDHRTATVEVGQFTDETIAERIREVQQAGGWTAIDVPFGFPTAFIQAVRDWHTDGRVRPATEDDIRRRLSDRYVQERQAAIKAAINAAIKAGTKKDMPGGWNTWPLSSVVDLITPSVIRCARLLTAVSDGKPVDRIGLTSGIVEAYPISALRVWGINTKNYKNDAADCDFVLKALLGHTGVSRPARVGRVAKGCEDDEVDAFVCALLAKVVYLADGATGPEAVGGVYAERLDTIREEGWIHLPGWDDRLAALAAT